MEYGKKLINEVNSALASLDAVLKERYTKDSKGFDEHSLITKEDAKAIRDYIGNLATLGGAGAVRGVIASGRTASWLNRHSEIHVALEGIRNQISGAEMIDGALVEKQKAILQWARTKTAELQGSI